MTIFTDDQVQEMAVSQGQGDQTAKAKPKAKGPDYTQYGSTRGELGGRQVWANPHFMADLKKADADMRTEGKQGIQVNPQNGDFRTYETEEEIYARHLKMPGGTKTHPAAHPGESWHGKGGGLAVDVLNWQEAKPYLAKYGITNPVRNDSVHFQYGDRKRLQQLAAGKAPEEAKPQPQVAEPQPSPSQNQQPQAKPKSVYDFFGPDEAGAAEIPKPGSGKVTFTDDQVQKQGFTDDQVEAETLKTQSEHDQYGLPWSYISQAPPKSLRERAADFARPTVEAAGMWGLGTAGAAGGALLPPPFDIPAAAAGRVFGAGLGGALGKRTMDLLAGGVNETFDVESLSLNPEILAREHQRMLAAREKYDAEAQNPWTSALVETLTDVGKFGAYEVLGGAGATLLGAGARGVANAVRTPPFADVAAQTEAGARLSELDLSLTPQERANARAAEALEKNLGIQPLTPAQRTGNMGMSLTEQSLGTKPGFAGPAKARDTVARETAWGQVEKALGKGKPLPETQTTEQTGANIHGALTSDLKAVKAQEKAIWSGVKDYPIPDKNLQGAVKTVTSEPLDEETKNAVERNLRFITETPKTTKGLHAIEQTLASDIGEALKAGKNKVARPLSILKASIEEDYKAMGEAARNGDVALHDGELIYPGKLKAALPKIDERIIEAQTAARRAELVKEAEAYHKSKGWPYTQQKNEGLASYEKRILGRYLEDVPEAEYEIGRREIDSPQLQLLRQEKAKVSDALNSAQPAQDIADKLADAKRFSRVEKFERFGKGVNKDVLAVGNQFEGQRLPFEKIPQKYYTPSGYRDLVRATGNNSVKAATMMRPYVTNDLITSATNANGEFSVQKGLQYLKKNQAVLKMSGLDTDVKDVIKGQMPGEFKRLLDVKRVDAVTGKPFFTVDESAKLLKNYGPAMDQLYGKKALQSLREYHQLMKYLDRNKYVSYSKGSTTTEKLVNMPGAPGRIRTALNNAMEAVMHASGSWARKTMVAKGVMAGVDSLRTDAEARVEKFFIEGLFDPVKAQAIKDLAAIPKSQIMKGKGAEIAKRIITLGETYTGDALIDAPERERRRQGQ